MTRSRDLEWLEMVRAIAWAPSWPSNASWLFAAWWRGTGSTSAMLYSWVVPRPPAGGEARWARATVEESLGIERVTIVATWSQLERFLGAVAEGSTLTEASEMAGLKPPDVAFGDRRLTAESGAYVLAPPTWHAPREAQTWRKFSGPASPMESVGAVVASLVRVDKLDLFKAADGSPLADIDVVRCLKALHRDTGFDFAAADAPRLGNLELLIFPAANLREHPLTTVRADGSDIRIDVDASTLPSTTELLVRCRQFDHGIVFADEVRSLQRGGETIAIAFPTAEGGPFPTEVEVWGRSRSSEPYRIWFEHTAVWIRRIGLRMGLVRMQGTVNSGWLDSWAHNARTQDRAEAQRAVRKVNYEQSEIGVSDPPFVLAAAQARKLVANLVPAPSDARFFERLGEPGSDGRLALAEWFRADLTGGVGAGRVLLVDPFFDGWGVELFARAEATQLRYSVLTSFAERRQGDSEERAPETGKTAGEDREASRQRLKAACEQLNLLLESMDFEILEASKRFHDRYVLVFDATDAVERGYHLSNSLSGAAKTHPLLVTPIPRDVLPKLVRYVHGIAGGATLLFRAREGDIPLKAEEVATEPPAKMEDAFELLFTEVDFGDAWRTFAAGLAHDPAPSTWHSRLIERDGTTLLERLFQWLRDEGPREVTGAKWRRTAAASLVGTFGQSFERALPILVSFLEHGRDEWRQPWSLHFGFSILAHDAPALYVNVLKDWCSKLPPNDAVLSEVVPAGVRLGMALAPLLMRRDEVGMGLVELLVSASTPSLRALGIALAESGNAIHAASGSERVRTVAPRLTSARERVTALAHPVYQLRVSANRANRVESDSSRTQRMMLFSDIVAQWPADADESLLRAVADTCGGPGSFAWSASTTEGLLVPLVEAKKVAAADVVNLWWGVLRERIAKTLTGNHQFYGHTDGDLTQVSAWLACGWWVEAENAIASHFDAVDALVKRASITLRRPFVRSADYKAWSGARDGLLWVKATGLSLQLQQPGAETPKRRALSWLNAADAVACESEGESRGGFVSDLQRFVAAFEAAVAQRTTSEAASKDS